MESAIQKANEEWWRWGKRSRGRRCI